MHKFSMRQTVIVILLAVLFGGTSLVYLGNEDFPLDQSIIRLRYVLIGTSLLILLLMSRFDIWYLPSKPVPLIFVWYLFSLVVFLSGWANQNATAIRDSFWFMFGIPTIFFYALPKLLNKSATIMIAVGLFLGLFPYIVACFLLNPIWQSQEKMYRGVFANSNQLGATGATIISSIFILLIGALSKRKSLLYMLSINLLLLVNLIVVLISNSRTSLLAFLAMLFLCIYKVLQNSNYIFIISNSIIFISIIFIANFLIAGEKYFWLLEKIYQIQDKEALSGRTDIWSKTIEDVQLLGHSSDYFEVNFGLGGHNTLIEILGNNGIIAAYLILGFAIASFFYAYFYFKKYAKEDPYASAPLVITTGFWVLSMGEGMFGSFGSAMTLAYMLSVGIVIAKFNTQKSQRHR